MILVTNLQKSFGSRHVLTGLDLEVRPGELTLLVGTNGAGKTTALRLIAGLSNPDAGAIAIAGHDLAGRRQDALAPRFHPRLTVRQTTEFYACLRGRPRAGAVLALEAWGLRDFAGVPTSKLSGGLRQRLALAIFALANAPVLLLDEPGLSLDPVWRERLQQFLRDETARGRTVLIATHLLGEWEGRADRCLLVENGRAGGELPPHRLRDHFQALGNERPSLDLQKCCA
jgi:ABC-type multidrug transport system ATPase subunit